jgi:hypothetical protein
MVFHREDGLTSLERTGGQSPEGGYFLGCTEEHGIP